MLMQSSGIFLGAKIQKKKKEIKNFYQNTHANQFLSRVIFQFALFNIVNPFFIFVSAFSDKFRMFL